MLSRRNRVLPSPNTTLHPLVWLLPMLTLLNVPLAVYVCTFIPLVTFFEQVLSLFQAYPRTQDRYDPVSRAENEHSNTIRVLLVPSVISVIRIAFGVGVPVPVNTDGMNG